MNHFYDNHANDIEFFEIKKPKVNRVRDERNLSEMTLEELNEKKIEIDTLFQDLINLNKEIPREETRRRIEKLSSYRTAMKIHIRKKTKDILSIQDIEEKSKCQKQLESEQKINSELRKENIKLSQFNEKLQIKASQLGKQINETNFEISKMREVEKTRRQELNLEIARQCRTYLTKKLESVLTKAEMLIIYEEMSRIQENTK